MFCRDQLSYLKFRGIFSVGILLQISATTFVSQFRCNFSKLLVRLGGFSTLIFGGKILIFLPNQSESVI